MRLSAPPAPHVYHNGEVFAGREIAQQLSRVNLDNFYNQKSRYSGVRKIKDDGVAFYNVDDILDLKREDELVQHLRYEVHNFVEWIFDTYDRRQIEGRVSKFFCRRMTCSQIAGKNLISYNQAVKLLWIFLDYVPGFLRVYEECDMKTVALEEVYTAAKERMRHVLIYNPRQKCLQ